MGRCDSFVVETDVHFPTDINLLFDAIRKMIETAAVISQDIGSSMWRQSSYNIKTFKRVYRTVQRLKHSTSDITRLLYNYCTYPRLAVGV